MTESTFTFDCHGVPLVGIVHRPAVPLRRGVLIVVGGGPQYRVGGHRQLTLWARRLCAEGFAVFRFDYRGMGDSQGDFSGFENVSDDIRSAVDEFQRAVPELEQIVLWGECDAASAILFYAHTDPRIKGAVLQNPWVRTEAGNAQAILRFYYIRRILQPSFWLKVFGLRFNPITAVVSAFRVLRQSRSAGPSRVATTQPTGDRDPLLGRDQPLPQRVLRGMTLFKGPVMIVISGRDIIAREFANLVDQSAAWQEQFRLKPVTRHDFPDSDHTFSSNADRTQVMDWALAWLRTW